jgi:hypothetical protein
MRERRGETATGGSALAGRTAGTGTPGKQTLTQGLMSKPAAPAAGPPAAASPQPASQGPVSAVPQLTGGDRLDGPSPDTEAAGNDATGSSGGMPLPPEARGKLEGRFGASLDDIRVHTDGDAAKRADAAGAQAFAVGKHIYFANGKYAPGTPEGEKLLAHEVVHTIQAGGGGGGRVSDPSEPAEREAESLANSPGQARPAQSAHGVMRQPNVVTPADIAAMARRPRAGIARWSKLTEQQRNDVLSAMTASYGVPFAAAFLQAAQNPGQRSYDISTATDGQDVGFATIDSAWLTAHGFRLVGLLGSTGPALWSRPNGEEYYLLHRAAPTPTPPPDSTAPQATTPAPQPPSPRDQQTQISGGLNRILVDARFGVTSWFDDLREARDARNASDYASTRQGLVKLLTDLDTRIADLRRAADGLLHSDPMGRDPDLDVRILDQLEAVDEWRSNVTRQLGEFPETMPP